MKTYRRVSHQMGAWKWGYPKGERHAIVEYSPRRTKDGRWIWQSIDELCDGITAANEMYYRKLFPVAFANTVGTLHNSEIDILNQLQDMPGGINDDRYAKLSTIWNRLNAEQRARLRIEKCADERTGRRYGQAQCRRGRSEKIGSCTFKYQIWAVWS